MKSSAKKIELASVDDLFSTEEGRQDAKLEKIQEIPLSELHPFRNHPFKVKDDEAMMETADSIKQYGVLVPAIARPDPEGGYELVAGHRRHRASELAGKETMPVIVRDLDDDAATMSVSEMESYRDLILENIEYDHLCREFTTYREDLDEIVELMVETVCAKRKTTRIAGSDFPHEVVRSRFLKLDSSHIEFVMECLRNNTTEIRNMKQYLLAVLFNAPTTISNHYTAQVNHDMYAGGW